MLPLVVIIRRSGPMAERHALGISRRLPDGSTNSASTTVAAPQQEERFIVPFQLPPPELIETEKLASLLSSDDVLLIDVCSDDNYDRGPLTGARHIQPASLTLGQPPAPGKLPHPDSLDRILESIGYEKDKFVIAYDDEGGGWAGRFLWILDVINHERKGLVNGGLIAWLTDGREVTTTVPTFEQTQVQLTADTKFIASLAEVHDSLGAPEIVIWDARSREEHQGLRSGSRRAGRIPGAINLDWLATMDPENGHRTRKDLQEVLEALGITRDKRVITHCQTHHRSGLTYVLGRQLGYDIRAYDGSWSEWGNHPDTPLEVG